MGTVYLARQPDLDREVALKELSSFHALDPGFAERFSREARIGGSLSHPNVVTMFEYFEYGGLPYIAMEYVSRGSLRTYVGRLSIEQIFGVLEGLLSALAYAHARGVVHRDLKPENILVTSEGSVKIADFGIAKAFNAIWTAEYRTATGMAIGTPAYMAPEQAMGRDVGPWTDIYATGVIAYELLAGHPPFHGVDEPLALLMQHLNEPVPPLRSENRDVDERLAEWVESLLVKDRALRPDATAAWEQLEDIVISVAGPVWRRHARLVELPAGAGGRPLTPAPFESSATPTPAAAAPPTKEVRPPHRRRRRAVVASTTAVVVLGAGAAALAVAGGGGANTSGSTLQASAPECIKRFVAGVQSADVVEGVGANVARRDQADGRTFALILANPNILGALRFTYRRNPEYFSYKGMINTACATPAVTFYGEGTLNAFPSYGNVEAVLAGRPYQVSLSQEQGVIGATLNPMKLAALRITAARRGRTLAISGAIAAGVHVNTVTVSVSAQPPDGPPVSIQQDSRFANGRGSGTLPLPAAVDHVPVQLSVSYPGDWEYAPDTVTLTVPVSGPA